MALGVGLSCSALALAGTGTGTGGEGDHVPSRPLTAAEAQRLALVRFNAFEASPETVTVKIDDGTDSYSVRGLIDYRTHRAIGTFVAGVTAQKQEKGLVAWDSSGLAIALGSGGTSPSSKASQIVRAAEKVRNRGWSPRAYAAYPLDTALHVVVALGQDRPDNAQLLAQFGARRLGESTLRGKSYTRFSGPRPRPQPAGKTSAPRRRLPSTSPLTYWVDEDGNLGRMEIKDAGMQRPITVDFLGHEPHAKVPAKPWQERSHPAG
ncbi:hypothetical protein [Streptomyces sp. L2]|uniref:hypothetical protein n=1 Tax=Streptomyces sp. L2 TaxID=2162665 RepID=UPI001011C763|nr:hypothetical protein [Streptomyces sp. L2]